MLTFLFYISSKDTYAAVDIDYILTKKWKKLNVSNRVQFEHYQWVPTKQMLPCVV